MMMITLGPHGSEHTGILTGVDRFPFAVERAFWITDWDEGARGNHAHRKQWQAFACLRGSVTIKKFDFTSDGTSCESFPLSDPQHLLVVPPMSWIVLEAPSADTVLLCLASGEYNEADYIRDFAEYQRIMRGG